MHNKDGQLLLVGKVVGVHGVKGEVKVLPYGDCGKKVWKMLCLSRRGHTLTCDVLGNRPHKGVIVVKLDGCNDRDSAFRLIGYDVFIDKEGLPPLPEGEYYNFQLEGMRVVTDDGMTVGIISSIFSTGSNDVYVVNGPHGEVLIPAISDVVMKVDVKERKMVIRVVEGLLSG